jgi:hypothetical protein
MRSRYDRASMNPKAASSSLFTCTSVDNRSGAVRDVRPFPVFGVGVVNKDAIIDIPKVAIDGTRRRRIGSKFDM